MATIKQKLAIKKIVENSGDIGKSMVEVGYSPKTDTTNLTKSKGWKELLEQYLPDDKLLKKHDEALEAKKWNDFTGEREEDQAIRLRAIELGYKLKGKLTENNVLQQYNIGEMNLEFIGKDESSIKQMATGSSEGQPQV